MPRRTTTRRGRRIVRGTVVALAILGVPTASSAFDAALAGDRPNLVVIMTDDHRADALTSMPTVRRELMRRGVVFRNAFVPNPLCCPSRVSTLTGLYSHDSGVYGNKAPHGGFTAFDDRVSIATVLGAEGYATAFIGKYLNGYGGPTLDYVPPGWDHWFAFGNGAYYDYRASVNGTPREFGHADADYSARVMTRQARTFLGNVPPRRPFFLFFAPSAAHASKRLVELDRNMPVPGPQDIGTLDGIERWRPDTFGARDGVSDMPMYIRRRAWDRRIAASIDLFRQRQLEALASLDRQLDRLLEMLPRDTLVMFMSDNGYLWGEHRWTNKRVPYEESIRIPLIVRWRGVVSHRVDRRLALNVDVAPTLLAAAGIDRAAPTGVRVADGSQLPAQGLDLLGAARRETFVLEHFDATSGVPAYCGVRTRSGWMYARYWEDAEPDNGFEELYDVRSDPLQQRNLAGEAAHGQQRAELRAQAVELCDPPPPPYRWPDP